MHYVSTRGRAPELGFEEVVLAGLADDGGLYVPKFIPPVSPQDMIEWAKLPYAELAVRVMHPFMGEDISEAELRELATASYAGFRHAATAPLVQVDEGRFILELFHGPTLAFKDFALQFLGRLLDRILQKRGEHITIIGATSGDTGSAAIAGCRGRDNMDIFIFHPKGRVSDVQRRQMTTVADANVHNIALEGTFDDCQDMVKALFADADFRREQKLAAVNSINWARILAQVVYYFYAALALGAPAREVSFSVPTGNFGDIYAGYIARQMGLPIRQLMIATNQNDILTRCVEAGNYTMQGVSPSLSPSMDIQISSNFERLLFDLHDRDGTTVAGLMERLKTDRQFALAPLPLSRLRAGFASATVSDEQTKTMIDRLYRTSAYLADPHTAVGYAAAEQAADEGTGRSAVPLVVLATAHPAKFPDAVREACGVHPALPEHMQAIMNLPEHFSEMPAGNVNQVREFIRTHQGVSA